MLFRDIPGHAEVKERLLRSVTEQRISHAQLFLGPEGSGSLALAIAYAQYITCENKRTDDSCGECSSCRKYTKLIHPDLHFSYPFIAAGKDDVASTYIAEWRSAIAEYPFLSLEQWMGFLSAENKQPNINIAECHDIIKKLTYKSFESEYKVLIMWLPEFLGQAGNSLLKLIEEPPPKTLFLLVAENYDQLLNTILSRTQLVKVPRFDDKDVAGYLLEQGSDEVRSARVAYLANGNMSAAVSMIAEEEDDLEQLFVQWFRLCFSRKGIEVLEWIDKVSTAKFGRENQKNLLRFGLQVIRDCLMLNEDLNEIVRFESRHFELDRLAGVINHANAPLIVKELEQAIYHIERNANPRILFLDLSIQMMRNLQLKDVNSQLT